VYFEFDSSAVDPNDISKIQAVADYLNQNSTEAVLIEGHCDERGTEEYNRALGERRALSVREILVLQMGVASDAVLTVSYGEDIPAVDGTTEEAYRMNRRGEFVLLRPKN
jgi:peptidoglycan-associated lipoprotein